MIAPVKLSSKFLVLSCTQCYEVPPQIFYSLISLIVYSLLPFHCNEKQFIFYFFILTQLFFDSRHQYFYTLLENSLKFFSPLKTTDWDGSISQFSKMMQQSRLKIPEIYYGLLVIFNSLSIPLDFSQYTSIFCRQEMLPLLL